MVSAASCECSARHDRAGRIVADLPSEHDASSAFRNPAIGSACFPKYRSCARTCLRLERHTDFEAASPQCASFQTIGKFATRSSNSRQHARRWDHRAGCCYGAHFPAPRRTGA